MRSRRGRTHHVVHDPTEINIEIVPVRERIHESRAFVGWGPDVLFECRTGLGPPRVSRGCVWYAWCGSSRHERAVAPIPAVPCIPRGLVVGVPLWGLVEIDLGEVFAVEESCS